MPGDLRAEKEQREEGMILADSRLMPIKNESVNCVVTSPPYWGLRDYGVNGQLGLESTPELYVEHMISVFREVSRVLRKDGTVWLNLGDSYNSIGHKKSHSGYGTTGLAGGIAQEHSPCHRENSAPGLKHKDLVGIPWRVAFALQADGWWLRSDIIWSKPNPMPESVTDRPTKAHEYIFLLTKAERYYFDQDAVKEPNEWPDHNRFGNKNAAARMVKELTGNMRPDACEFTDRTGRNIRSVWEMATQPWHDCHFATFPEELAKRCILAGSRPGNVILDPFCGSGTTVKAAKDLGRRGIGLDIKLDYLRMAQRRSAQEGLMFV